MPIAPKAITFDAAGTIVEVRFDLAEFVLKLAREFGIGVDAAAAGAIWEGLWKEHVARYERRVRAGVGGGRRRLWLGFFAELFAAAADGPGLGLPAGESVAASEDPGPSNLLVPGLGPAGEGVAASEDPGPSNLLVPGLGSAGEGAAASEDPGLSNLLVPGLGSAGEGAAASEDPGPSNLLVPGLGPASGEGVAASEDPGQSPSPPDTRDPTPETRQPKPETPLLQAMADEFDRRVFAPDADHWRLYPDAKDALEALKARRVRMAVVSNWDESLFTVLDLIGATDYFEFALASLVEGWEKPARELFGIAVRRLGYEPFEVVHVGDNPIDDIRGARGAGLFPVLIDRDGSYPGADCVRISKLTDLVGLYG